MTHGICAFPVSRQLSLQKGLAPARLVEKLKPAHGLLTEFPPAMIQFSKAARTRGLPSDHRCQILMCRGGITQISTISRSGRSPRSFVAGKSAAQIDSVAILARRTNQAGRPQTGTSGGSRLAETIPSACSCRWPDTGCILIGQLPEASGVQLALQSLNFISTALEPSSGNHRMRWRKKAW